MTELEELERKALRLTPIACPSCGATEGVTRRVSFDASFTEDCVDVFLKHRNCPTALASPMQQDEETGEWWQPRDTGHRQRFTRIALEDAIA